MKEKENTVKGDCHLGVIQNSSEEGLIYQTVTEEVK